MRNNALYRESQYEINELKSNSALKHTKTNKMTDMLKTGLIPWFSKTPIKTLICHEDIDGLGIIEHSVVGCRPLTSEEIEEEKKKINQKQIR